MTSPRGFPTSSNSIKEDIVSATTFVLIPRFPVATVLLAV
jgi:hypothetical protein